MDHYGAPQLHVCPAGRIVYPNEIKETRVKTGCETFNNKKYIMQVLCTQKLNIVS